MDEIFKNFKGFDVGIKDEDVTLVQQNLDITLKRAINNLTINLIIVAAFTIILVYILKKQ